MHMQIQYSPEDLAKIFFPFQSFKVDRFAYNTADFKSTQNLSTDRRIQSSSDKGAAQLTTQVMVDSRAGVLLNSQRLLYK